MKIQFFCPRWGSEHIPWPAFLDKVRAVGYDGVEWAIPGRTSSREIDEVKQLASKHGLLIIAQHYDTNEPDFNRHFAIYAAWLEKVKAFPWLKINSQTGKDYFTTAQNVALIKLAGDVMHETHRGKFSFAAHITMNYLEAMQELRLTLDASHWVNVAESFLEDQQAALEMAITRTDHIHARVGYPEGPQVAEPRASEWQLAVSYHLNWWDQVVNLKRTEPGDAVLTITPEFGPHPYMVQIPFSREPVSDQWAVNVYVMELLRKRYA
jgi:sugar phosphate isomerase/epimerase